MDHFSKALDNATRDRHSVRTWVQPPRQPGDPGVPGNDLGGQFVRLDPAYLEENRILWGKRGENQAIADKYRMLRTQLLMRMRGSGWRRLAVTSPGPRAGKTLTCINLAISMARDGNQRVVLIDADLRRPSIAQTLGLETDIGLIDYLAGDAPLEALALIPEDVPNLTVIPGRRADPSKAQPELFSSTRMRELMDWIGRSADPTIIIVDLPPVFVGDDVILVAEQMDSVLLVVEEGATEVEELKNAAQLLEDFNLIGTVLNKSTERRREEMNGYYHSASNASQD